MAWTDEQLAAMRPCDGNLLVAAGAGSGKTAVLIERVLGMITDKNAPVDVDRLLIVTFTNAAAAEMRLRLTQALHRRAAEQPDDQLIARQLVLIQRAHITTIHSFCLELLKEHGYLIGLDAKSRIGSEGELNLLRERVMDEVFEAAYADGQSGLKELLAHYCRGIGDESLRALVLKMIGFGQSMPDVEAWLCALAEPYNARPAVWLACYADFLRGKLPALAAAARRAYKLAEDHALEKYLPLLQEEAEILTAAEKAAGEDVRDILARLQGLEFKRMPAITAKDEADPEAKERVRKMRAQVKDGVGDILRQSLPLLAEPGEPGSLSAELARLRPLAEALIKLARNFYQAWQEAKRRARLWEFADLEHYALRLLQDASLGVAAELQARFHEVMVDEYQDINQVQETLLAALSRSDNRFMVGDIKQSIYRFRLAEPGLFLQKFNDYGRGIGGQRIDLNRNFRSQPGVLAGVNFIFSRLMTGGSTEIVYDEAAMLSPGRTDLPEEPCELLIIDKQAVQGQRAPEQAEPNEQTEPDASADVEAEGGEGENSLADMRRSELEGRLLAARLLAEHKAGYQWGDMVVLLRSYSTCAPAIKRELTARGIPCLTDSQEDFISLPEVQIVLNLLAVLDNPRQDIPLTALLHSPLVGLKLADLADLRIVAAPPAMLYDALRQTHRPELLRFLLRLDDWRQKSRELGVYELLEYIFNRTALPELVGSLPGGELRRHNLGEILRLAREYDESGGLGLARFLRYLKAAAGKTAPADKRESADAVRLMSVHKSKGLQFPVVFVAGLGNELNESDFRQDILLHKTLGLGMRRVEPEQRRKYPSFGFNIIKNQIRTESVAEELRILYVAMTRAEKKLVLVGTANMKRLAESVAAAADGISPDFLLKTGAFLPWVTAALLDHPDAEPLRSLAGAEQTKPKSADGRWHIEIITELPETAEEAAEGAFSFADWLTAGDDGIEQAEIAAALRREYPMAELQRLPVKWSATALDRLQPEHIPDEQEQAAPPADIAAAGAEFAEDMQAAPGRGADWYAEYGSLCHALLEKIDLRALAEGENAEALFARLLGDIAAEYPADVAAAVEPRRLARIFSLPLGQRLLGAVRGRAAVLREQRFTLEITAAELKDLHENAWDKLAAVTGLAVEEIADESLFFQGVIDLAFYDEESGGWVLVDYKSGANRGLSDDDVAAKYAWQLGLYRYALAKALRQPVSAAYIMFAANARAVKIF